MTPLAKILLALVLFAPGGFLLLPLLWFTRHMKQRRARLAREAHAAVGAAGRLLG